MLLGKYFSVLYKKKKVFFEDSRARVDLSFNLLTNVIVI